jgi:hypothetical protein
MNTPNTELRAVKPRQKSWPLCAMLLIAAIPATAQTNYTIDWFTMDGGGGTCTNGVYTLSGTLGQPDAGTMSGGNFTLHGGFWGILAAVQIPGAPRLSIASSNTSVIVSWPLPTGSWLLEQTNRLTGLPGPWPLVAAPYVTNANTISVTVPASTANMFFRLRQSP